MEEVVGAQRDKEISKNFGVIRRGLKRREFRSTIDRDASLNFRHNKARLEISEEHA